jgi:bisphosphoglycerate-independent phosphoglycerate mutase (AlkP superfamily)
MNPLEANEIMKIPIEKLSGRFMGMERGKAWTLYSQIGIQIASILCKI